MMGVYFKGMEMPDNCAVCPIMNQDDCYCEVIHNKADDIWNRPNWCPAVEVLKPHGDLIDVNALIDWAIRQIKELISAEPCTESQRESVKVSGQVDDLISRQDAERENDDSDKDDWPYDAWSGRDDLHRALEKTWEGSELVMDNE